MAVDGYLNFNTRIDTKGFNAGTKQITSGLTGMKSMLGKIGLAMGTAFSVKAVVNFGKEAINTASDIQEVQNVVDVSFSQLKGKMEEFADTAIETYGISKLTAKQTGSTYMAMAKGMQIVDDKAADMALTLTGLSADMASFYNKEQSVTSTALNSIFTGETETLKQFGIVMTEANLQQFAYTQGINKKISAMSQAEKVMLRYNYVMSQTALAQGDFVRTQDGWANQTRILTEQWREFSGTVGTIFMNTLLPAVQNLNKAMLWLNSIASSVLENLAAIFDWDISSSGGGVETYEGISDAIGTSVENQNALTDAVKETAEAQKRELMGFDKINKLSDDSSSSGSTAGTIGGITTGSNSIPVDVDTSKAEKTLTDFQKRLKEFVGSLKITFNDVFVDWEDLSGEQIAEKIISALSGIVGAVIGFSLGGVPGAIIGTVAGVGISLIISSLTFDHNGKLNGEEILSLVTMALTSIAGGIVGFTVGGVSGAAVGIALGTAVSFAVNELSFNTDGTLTGEEIAKYAIMALGGIAGGIIGFSLGGAGLAAIIATCTIAFSMGIVDMSFDNDGNLSSDEIIGMIVTALCGIAGGIVGFAVGGGPAGAVVGATIGMGISMLVNQIDWGTLSSDVSTGFSNVLQNAKTFLSNKKVEFSAAWNDTVSAVKDKTVQMKANIATKKADLKKNWDDRVSVIKDKTANAKLKWSQTKKDIKKAAKNRYDAITEVFGGIPNWFKEKFADAWKKVKGVFSSGGETFKDIKDGILTSLKTIINKLIDGINDIIKKPFDGINTALQKLKDIKIGSAQPFKDKIQTITVPKIPKLATGTVVPANYGEFLAVLGDNKREPEIVSPESAIRKVVSEELNKNGGGAETINLVIELDGDVLYRTVVKKNNQNKNMTGVNELATA